MPLTSPDGYLDFTNAVPRAVKMVATSNVGIGTSSPIYALDVHGTSNTGPLTVSSLTLANGAIEGDLNISGNLVYTSNTTTIVNSNVVVEYTGPHGRDPKEVPLKKYPEIVFDASKLDGNDTTNTYTQAGYTVTASSQSSGAEVWRLFDDGYGAGSYWNQENVNKYPSPAYTYSPPSNSQSLGGTSGEWFKLELPQKIIVNKIEINAGNNVNYAPLEFKIFGSNNDTDWTVVKDVNGLTTSSYSSVAPFITMIESVSSVAYKYYAIVFTRLYAATQVSLHEFKFYGYEEDPPAGDTSIDTTFTSIMNTPQTTGANVYIDGNLGSAFTNRVTGPLTATGTSTTYDSTGKYWELNGELTSNITVEANTFLEGDQPHAVSVWFNSSNLEANTANTCVFTISDQENLDSYNLDLQSNTWHNLTYSYQGEGGSRVTYLDGRKVAEDQAEDTFGDYPPFAMTGYSQGGYVASTNNFYTAANNERDPWRAYDGLTDSDSTNCWGTKTVDSFQTSGEGLAQNNTSGNPDTFIDETGTLHTGHWNKIELPHKLQVDYISIYCELNDVRVPGKVAILGSNDDEKWYLLKDVTTNLDFTTATPQVVPMENNKNKGFKYLILVVKTVPSLNGAVTIREISYYGHRENDLVRLPDPTRVLKYPHVALSGPAQRGYVASASGFYSDSAGQHDAWKAFNQTGAGTYTFGWHSHIATNLYGGGDGAYGSVRTSNLGLDSGGTATPQGGTRENGEWIKLHLPHKITLSFIKLLSSNNDNTAKPEDFQLYGSNDETTWNEILRVVGANPDVTTPGTVYTPSSTPIAYNYFGLVITRTSGRTNYFMINELELYGTEEATSIPIQIGGGNIDKVANFRVYDKFIGEDQALEIWDAQKDEFGRAKSSMTLHKGRLGIGTTEPEGRLAVLDEPHNFEEFPPRAMTDYDTYIEGHGMFRVRTSNDRTDISWFAWRAFDKDVTTDIGWHTTSTFTGTNNTHDGTESLGRFLGEWVKLEMPHKLQLSHVEIVSRDYIDLQQPIDFKIIGSNDNINWIELIDVTGQSWTQGQTLQFYVTSQIKAYRYIALVCSRANNTALILREIKYFGTPEQSQSVLHDGELALMKSLTVPRIGPVNNEYPTPKRDKLLLEYNTALSIHEDLAIDTSGRSNDGTYYGAATYRHDDTFILSGGSGTKVEGNVNGYGGGSSPFSISLWFNSNSTNTDYIAGLGNYNSSPNNHISGILIRSNGTVGINHYNNDTTSVAGVLSRTPGWNHIVYTYSGGSTTQGDKIYLNGVNVPLSPVTSGTHSGQTISVAANAKFTLGGWAQDNSNMFSGKISNAKVYSIALDRYDIIQLYKQGRVPPVHHLQLVDSTMTIGSHTRNHNIQLDVAGHIRAGGQEIHTFTGQHRCFPDEPVEKGLIVSAKKNQYVKLNGFATGQEAITIDESLPIVSLSNVAEDKACFGVVSSIEKPTPKRIQITNGIISDSKKERGDNRAIVNSVGEGAIWVVNTGGPLESGDYITTSNVAGYGQKQEDDVLHNYTVAKITMDCDFTGSNVAVQTIKREETGLRTITEDVWNTLVDYDRSSATETQYSNTLDPEAYSGQSGYTPREVTTIVDYTDGSNLISIAEWSNLESNIQNTYQSNTFTEIADYTKFISLDEWSNLTIDVQNTYSEAEITTYYQIQRGENVLDENGQLQFEDKTGATEAPYERRFLDASGAQTDEANAVHIAAFVGCTYHCG